MNNINLLKQEKLGMSFGKANYILQRNIMFSLMKKCKMDKCYRCDRTIDKVEEMSIDHIEDWLHSNNPIDLFFDVDNIAFSHLSCNISGRGCNAKIGNKHGFKGVCYDKSKAKKWRAQIVINNKKVMLGSFNTPKEAAKAYDEAAIKHYGEKAITNSSAGLL